MLQKKLLVCCCFSFSVIFGTAQMPPQPEQTLEQYTSPPFVEMILIALGIILLGYYLLFVLNGKQRKTKAATMKTTIQQAEMRSQSAFSTARPIKPTSDATNAQLSNKIFQQFVFSRFPVETFDVMEWRDDFYDDALGTVGASLPSLELRSKKDNHHFGVITRWRHGFTNDCIEWAHSSQLQSYKECEYRTRQHLFLVLGVGGKPLHPEKLFIIPIRRIDSTSIHASFANKYFRGHTNSFNLSVDGIFLE